MAPESRPRVSDCRTPSQNQGGMSRRRGVSICAAVIAAAFAGAGMAWADGLGVFSGITAAQHPRSKVDRLDPSVVASIALDNKQRRLHHSQLGLLAPDSSRFVRQL